VSLPLAIFSDGRRLEAPPGYIERTAGLDRATLERARASRIWHANRRPVRGYRPVRHTKIGAGAPSALPDETGATTAGLTVRSENTRRIAVGGRPRQSAGSPSPYPRT
jgi:hypothetical protein